MTPPALRHSGQTANYVAFVLSPSCASCVLLSPGGASVISDSIGYVTLHGNGTNCICSTWRLIAPPPLPLQCLRFLLLLYVGLVDPGRSLQCAELSFPAWLPSGDAGLLLCCNIYRTRASQNLFLVSCDNSLLLVVCMGAVLV